MRKILNIFLLGLMIVLLVSCDGELVVENGSGSGVYSYGTKVAITANLPTEGEKFYRWTGDVGGINNQYENPGTISIGRKHALIKPEYVGVNEIYDLKVSGGTGSGSYEPGTLVEIMATVPTDHKFVKWTGDIQYIGYVGNLSQKFRMPRANMSLTATFIQMYDLTVVSGTGSGKYYPDKVVSIKANDPQKGYRFDAWTGDTEKIVDVKSRETTLTMPSKNITVKASYKEAPYKHRVIVSSDIGGYDPDDEQSMVHLLMYSNDLEIEGLISSPPGPGRAEHIHAVIDAYSADYDKLRDKGYPEPDELSKVVKQGATDRAPDHGYSHATEGSNWIIERARFNDERPLYILVWGSATDVAQAVHDDPGIKSKIRVYYIGSWNTMMDRGARDYLHNHHSDLWMIESDSTMRGMYEGGNQSGDLGNGQFVEQHVRGHGSLGDFFWSRIRPECNCRDIKMGDTPSVLYMLSGDPSNPEKDSWGGRFVKTGHGPNYWSDDRNPVYMEQDMYGAKTVSKHREAYLRDWQKRMEYLK